jgi:hypothetical protein
LNIEEVKKSPKITETFSQSSFKFHFGIIRIPFWNPKDFLWKPQQSKGKRTGRKLTAAQRDRMDSAEAAVVIEEGSIEDLEAVLVDLELQAKDSVRRASLAVFLSCSSSVLT